LRRSDPEESKYPIPGAKGWLSCLKGDPKFVIAAASHAQKAADYALQSAGEAEAASAAQGASP